MKTETLKLKTPRISKIYSHVKFYSGSETTQQSQNSDPTTNCTTVFTSTHVFKV
jgi:hypothetical protein